MDIPVTVRGNLTDEPEVRDTQNGQMVKLSVAVNHQRYDKGQSAYVEDGESYARVAVFGKLAQNVAESLHKGYPVIVTGTIRERPYQDKATGETKRPWEVKAQTVGVDLQFSTVGQVNRPQTGGGNHAAYGGQQGHQGASGGQYGSQGQYGGSGAYSGGQGSGPHGDPWGGGQQSGGSWETPGNNEPPF